MTTTTQVRLRHLTEDLTPSRFVVVGPSDEVADPTIASATHTITASERRKGAQVKIKKRVRIEPGDLVFSRLHTQNGAFAFSSESFQATSTFVPLRVRDELIDRRYLFWALHRFVPTLSTMDTVGRETYKTDDILALQIPVPSRPRQERATTLLDGAQALLEERRRGIATTNKLIPTLFNEMFGSPLTNERGWDSVTLGQLGQIVTGNTPSRANPQYYGEHLEWVKTNNIDAERGVVWHAAEGLSRLGARVGRVVPPGAVLVTCIAGSIERIGDAAIVDREVAINQQINAVIPHDGVDCAFLTALVGALRPQIHATATGAMTRLLNKSSLAGVPAFLPPLPLQRTFAARVAAIRKLQDAQATSQQELERFFGALLHAVFSGDI